MATTPAPHVAHPDDDKVMTPTYVRVIVIEVLVLAALWFFQEYFSR